MNKNVLLISSSPRIGGNSDMLCDAFLKGAVSAGHTAEKIVLKDKNILYCCGCGYCNKNRGSCSIEDDMLEIKEKLTHADVIVLATPIYFYAMCGQLKTFIDRNCFFYPTLAGKEFYYILTAAAGSTRAMERTLGELRGYLCCIPDAEEKGILSATGVWDVGDIADTKYLDDAFQMGKRI